MPREGQQREPHQREEERQGHPFEALAASKRPSDPGVTFPPSIDAARLPVVLGIRSSSFWSRRARSLCPLAALRGGARAAAEFAFGRLRPRRSRSRRR